MNQFESIEPCIYNYKPNVVPTNCSSSTKQIIDVVLCSRIVFYFVLCAYTSFNISLAKAIAAIQTSKFGFVVSRYGCIWLLFVMDHEAHEWP